LCPLQRLHDLTDAFLACTVAALPSWLLHGCQFSDSEIVSTTADASSGGSSRGRRAGDSRVHLLLRYLLRRYAGGMEHVRQVRIVLVLHVEKLRRCGCAADLLLLPSMRRECVHLLLLLLPRLQSDIIRTVHVRDRHLRMALLRAHRQIVVCWYARETQSDTARPVVGCDHLLLQRRKHAG
jgi:hypothetical protein